MCKVESFYCKASFRSWIQNTV